MIPIANPLPKPKKRIVIGQEFRLPRVSREIFMEIVKVAQYKTGTGIYIIPEGNEVDAFKVFLKHFNNFEIIKKCNLCGQEFIVDENWRGKGGLDDYISGEQEYLEHIQSDVWEKNKEMRIFEDILIRLGLDIEWFRVRKCPSCFSKLEIVSLGFYNKYFKCGNCRMWIEHQYGEEAMNKLLWHIKMIGFRNLFKEVVKVETN